MYLYCLTLYNDNKSIDSQQSMKAIGVIRSRDTMHIILFVLILVGINGKCYYRTFMDLKVLNT